MRKTTQEDTFPLKESFEQRADIFGVKINKYHVDNGIFSEQPFRSVIEDSNQK